MVGRQAMGARYSRRCRVGRRSKENQACSRASRWRRDLDGAMFGSDAPVRRVVIRSAAAKLFPGIPEPGDPGHLEELPANRSPGHAFASSLVPEQDLIPIWTTSM